MPLTVRGTLPLGHCSIGAPRSPPQQQPHYQTSYAAGSNIVCALPRAMVPRQQAASTEAPQGGSDGPPGVNAVQFVVLPFHSSGSSWEWEAPLSADAGNSHSGRASLGTALPLCSALYSPCILSIWGQNCKSSR